MNEIAPNWRRYDYDFDPQGETGPAHVLRLVGSNKRVLELGCGPGVITRKLREQGCSVVAVEIDPVLADQARSHAEDVIVADLAGTHWIEQLQGKGQPPFDCVVAADVLEHLVSPWQCLQQLHRLLTPTGTLVVCLPNIAHNGVLAALATDRFAYRDSGLLDRTHLRFFTRHGLEDLLLSSGFRPQAWRRYGVAVEGTEFADAWQAAPEALRAALASSAEGETYQFVVLAERAGSEPVAESAAAPVGEGDEEARTLAAYQQAFEETRSLLLRREAELSACHQALAEAQAVVANGGGALAKWDEERERTAARIAMLERELNLGFWGRVRRRLGGR